MFAVYAHVQLSMHESQPLTGKMQETRYMARELKALGTMSANKIGGYGIRETSRRDVA